MQEKSNRLVKYWKQVGLWGGKRNTICWKVISNDNGAKTDITSRQKQDMHLACWPISGDQSSTAWNNVELYNSNVKSVIICGLEETKLNCTTAM